MWTQREGVRWSNDTNFHSMNKDQYQSQYNFRSRSVDDGSLKSIKAQINQLADKNIETKAAYDEHECWLNKLRSEISSFSHANNSKPSKNFL
jgi:hypothetical protein